MRAIISAILRAMRETAQTALDGILNFTAKSIGSVVQVFGFGGASSLPPPSFEAPMSTTDLVEELRGAPAVRDLDRDGVKTVFNFAKASNQKRATYDLAPVRRADVQALLLKMTPDQLTTLTLEGSHAVRRLLLTGDAGVSGVPSVPKAPVDDFEDMPVDEQLAKKLKALRERMAKPPLGGSRPYVMPTL